MPRRTHLLAALTAGFALAAAAPATAAPDVGMADDRLLFASPESADETATAWRAAGVDTVRIIARWGAIAPAANDTSAPDGFDAADPNDPRYDWRALDRAVSAVADRHMRVVLSVTGWGPVWGSEFPVKRNPRYKPSPEKFARFATAVARRYGATVDRYIVWNEPNVAQWLQPQSSCSAGGRCTPYAPHHYRRLVHAAEPAIRAADPGAQIMVGALAPRGTSGTNQNGNLRPLTFLRELGCVTRTFGKVRTGACRNFRPVTADLLAHHPHGLKLAPTTPDPQRDNAQLADLPRLTRVVDGIAKVGGIRVRNARRLPLYLDEYAYQTNPPDRVLGVTRAQQAAWLAQSAYLAARNPRVKGLVWYVWRDEPLAGGSGGWQSGLLNADGSAKPALAAFPRPFWADGRRLWGQVRPGDAHAVTVERRAGAGWQAVRSLTTRADGTFTLTAARAGTYRFRDDGGASASRTVR